MQKYGFCGMMQKKKFKHTIQSFFPVLFSFFLIILCLLYGSTLPYVGYNAWNYNIYSLIAHNYIQFGFLPTLFSPIISVQETLPSAPLYYLNHPPLLSLGIALIFTLFGESFFSGRLISLIAALSSSVLLYLIARLIVDRVYASIVVVCLSVIPASIVFGKMIGQESLVLCFALLSVYSFLLYAKSKSLTWMMIFFLSGVLGTVTDWPMIYFALCMQPFFFYKKQKKLGLLFLAVTICSGFCYLVYASMLQGDVNFLYNGFLNRSVGNLIVQGDWVYLWFLTQSTRLFLYFNPFLVLFSVWYFIKEIRRKSELSCLVFSLLSFGLLHVLLYPEGSYGHPYWLYYLLPSILFSSAYVVMKYLRRKWIFFVAVLVLSYLYFFIVIDWKVNETKGNMFRYELARIASENIPDYASIAVNRNGIIDPDIFQFGFRHHTFILEDDQVDFAGKEIAAIVYSCRTACDKKNTLFRLLKNKFNGVVYKSKDFEMWVFEGKMTGVGLRTVHIDIASPKSTRSLFSKLYLGFLRISSAPQL